MHRLPPRSRRPTIGLGVCSKGGPAALIVLNPQKWPAGSRAITRSLALAKQQTKLKYRSSAVELTPR